MKPSEQVFTAELAQRFLDDDRKPADPKMLSPYHRWIRGWVWDDSSGEWKPSSIVVDVYSVLDAYPTDNPALDHAIKKALVPGGRGHKTRAKDMYEIRWSVDRALEIERSKNPQRDEE